MSQRSRAKGKNTFSDTKHRKREAGGRRRSRRKRRRRRKRREGEGGKRGEEIRETEIVRSALNDERRFLERKIEKDKGNYLDGQICFLWYLNLSLILFYPNPKFKRIAGSFRWSHFWDKKMCRNEDFCPECVDAPIFHPYCVNQLVWKDKLWPLELL